MSESGGGKSGVNVGAVVVVVIVVGVIIAAIGINNQQQSPKKEAEKVLKESVEKELTARFTEICDKAGIDHTVAPVGVSKLNGIVERFNRTVSEMSNPFLYAGRMSPIFWIFAYKHSTWIYNRIMHGKLGPHSPFEVVHARRPRFDRLHTLFCDMWEWLPGPKTPGINKGRKLIYLGISETCDTGYLAFEPESRTV